MNLGKSYMFIGTIRQLDKDKMAGRVRLIDDSMIVNILLTSKEDLEAASFYLFGDHTVRFIGDMDNGVATITSMRMESNAP